MGTIWSPGEAMLAHRVLLAIDTEYAAKHLSHHGEKDG